MKSRLFMKSYLYPTPAGSTLARALKLRHHEQGPDSHRPMEGTMTVFGFGRSDLESYPTQTPARSTVGFFETREAARVEAFFRSLFEPLDGAAEPGGQPG